MSRVTRRRYFLPLILIFSVILRGSNGLGGVFELRLQEFSNPSARDMEGNCCVNPNTRLRSNASTIISTSTTTSNISYDADDDDDNNRMDVCGGPCLKKFRVCIKHYQATVDPNPPCSFGEASTTNIYVDKAINQEFKFPFNFRWPDVFSLVIEAWHHSPFASSTKKLVSRMAIQQYSNSGGDKWRSGEWIGNDGHSSLTYEYKITCLPNYFGGDCGKACMPRNDTFGHYQCNSLGDKICLPGWSGSYCEQPICRPGCQGVCVVPNQCDCYSGWEGPLCSKCVRYPGCKHGSCNNPWECKCDRGWGGLFCNQDLRRYCATQNNNNPCKNGGTCLDDDEHSSYSCSCPIGFIGANCETASWTVNMNATQVFKTIFKIYGALL